MNNRTISSIHFAWKGNRGVAEVSDIECLGFNPFNGSPITVISDRTQARKVFKLDTSVPGYEDGWDGEACYYVSDDGFKISIFND